MSVARSDSLEVHYNPTVEEGASFPLTLFLKAKDAVKRVAFSGSSIQDLRAEFRKQFSSISSLEHRLPFYIMHQDTKIFFELECLGDLYQNCVVELRYSKEAVTKAVQEIGFGYYAFQKQKLVFCMVGLPARGKSYIAKKIFRYLKWNHVPTQIFNVGAYRRARLGGYHTHEFFDPDNEQGMRQRRHIAIAALDDMLQWLNQGGKVAIYDATNTTEERRNMVLKRCSMEGVQVVFIETISNDPEIVDKYISDVKSGTSPEYTGFHDGEQAEQDFRARIALYEKNYQPIDSLADSHLSWVKIVDGGKQVLVNNIESYVTSRVIHFLMNLHIVSRPIWLTRHGQSEFNLDERLGGDPPLTDRGQRYAHALADWVEQNIRSKQCEGLTERLTVWTSTLKRSMLTAQYINHPKVALRSLDEIDAGICDSLTYNEVAEHHPEEFAARAADKLRYRYPGGESYVDVMTRLEPVIFELERQKQPILIVGHQAILRALLAYFHDLDPEDIPHYRVDLETLYVIKPGAHHTEVKVIKMPCAAPDR